MIGITNQVLWETYSETKIDTKFIGECSKKQYLWEGRNEGCRIRQKENPDCNTVATET